MPGGAVGHATEPVGHATEPVGHATEPVGHATEPVGHATETRGRELDADQSRPRPRQSRQPFARRQKRREQRVLYDEIDVEEAVRDRLYGRRGRRD
jgi:hypothetical protein